MKARCRFVVAASLFAFAPCAAFCDTLDRDDFEYSLKIHVAGFTGASEVADLPVSVRLSSAVPAWDASKCGTDGSELRFSLPDGTLLSHQIAQWIPDGVSLVWVKLPRVTSSTVFYANWGLKDGRTAPAVAASDTWSDFKAVWHFDEESGPVLDASGNDWTATISDSAYANICVGSTMAKSGLSRYFQWVSFNVPDTDNRLDIGETMTVSCWVRADYVASGVYYSFLSRKNTIGGDTGFAFRDGANTQTRQIYGSGSASGSATGSALEIGRAWRYLTAVWDGTTAQIYCDGVAQLATPATIGAIVANDLPFRIGGCINGSTFWGRMDEMRVAPVARSAAWIKADYEAQSETFVTNGLVTGNGRCFASCPDRSFPYEQGTSYACTPVVHNPESGYEITYSTSQDGVYSAKQPAYEEVGDHLVWYCVAAPGLASFTSSVHVVVCESMNAAVTAAIAAKTIGSVGHVALGYFETNKVVYFEPQLYTGSVLKNAFDGSYSTTYALCSPPAYNYSNPGYALPYTYHAGERVIVKRYRVKGGLSTASKPCSWNPDSWELQGSDNPYDDASWETIDVGDNKGSNTTYGNANKGYPDTIVELPGNTKAYRAYRFGKIPSSGSNWWLQLTELELFVVYETYPNGVKLTPVTYTGVYDAKSHAAALDVVAPADTTGWAITYAEREEGPYSATPPAYTHALVTNTWIKVEGGATYGTHLVRAGVNISRKPVASGWIAAIPDQSYTGSAIEPPLTVVDPDSHALVLGTDYTVVYANNVECGTATATITGIGDYQGTAAVTFLIVPSFQPIDGKIYVDPVNGDDSSTTGDPDHPLKSIETAVFGARDGDEIRLVAGTHALARAVPITGRSNLKFLGPSSGLAEIVPATDVKTRLFEITSSTNITLGNVTFAHTHAYWKETGVHKGGALYVASSEGIRIENCNFLTNCIDGTYGAADNQLVDVLGYGGAIYSSDSTLVLLDCLFEGNTATQSANYRWDGHGSQGGALYATGGSVHATNCLFRQNGSVGYHGYGGKPSYQDDGGSAVALATPATKHVFSNCCFVRNRDVPQFETVGYSAVFFTSSSTDKPLYLVNCTVADNVGWYGISTYFKARVYATDTLIEGHEVDAASGVTQTLTGGSVGSTFAWKPTDGKTWYVAAGAEASDANAGTEAAPFRSLAKALSVAEDGDTVRLAEGRYAPSSGETVPYALDNRYYLTLIGAGKGKTVVDAEGTGALFEISNCERISVRGITFVRGRAANRGPSGVSTYASGNVTFSDCAFAACTNRLMSTSDSGQTYSGVLYGTKSMCALFEDCDVTNCVADLSGASNANTVHGLCCRTYGSTATFLRCRLAGNFVVGNATCSAVVGQDLAQPNPLYPPLILRNTLVAANRRSGSGSGETRGVSSAYGKVQLQNTTVAGNGDVGLSVEVNAFYTPNFGVYNSVIAGHGTADLSAGFGDTYTATGYNDLKTSVTFGNVVVGLQTEGVPTRTAGRHSIAATTVDDPKFRLTGGVLSRNHYALQAGSPAIDAGGVYSWIVPGAKDLNGKPRVSGTAPDLGCFEDGHFTIVIR